MKISGMDKRIILQAPTKVGDGMGGYTTSYTDIDTVWAKKSTFRSDESVQAMRDSGKLTHNYRMRYRRDIRITWRIYTEGKYMAIIGPPIEKKEGPGRHWTDIVVEEAS